MTYIETSTKRWLSSRIWTLAHRERLLVAPSRIVTSVEIGKMWPLVVDEVELFHGNGAIFLRAGGTLYYVNGFAKGYLRGCGEEVRDIAELQRDDASIPGAKMSTTPLFEAAQQVKTDKHLRKLGQPSGRRFMARGTTLFLWSLSFAARLLTAIVQTLTHAIQMRGGSIISILLFALTIAAAWLTTGILFQEVYEAITGLWQRKFWEHGIFFSLAAPFTIVVLVIYMISHQSDKSQ